MRGESLGPPRRGDIIRMHPSTDPPRMIDFDFTDDQPLVRETPRDFASREMPRAR